MRNRLSRLGALALLLTTPATAAINQQRGLNASEIELALRKLNVVGTALYIAAHPDDENTAMLAWLSNERLVRAGYLSLTRGDGGQNLIGTEKGDLLGVIRTQELLAARRIDGTEQFFTRAIDFGYSKSPAETFRIWDKDKLLSDVVWVIRKFQPDVIITRFPVNADGGHGQHTASAILAGEAFRAAADRNRFPEQLAFVQPWQAKRVFWNSWRPQNEPVADTTSLLKIDLGTYNPLLGESYSEYAARSRSMHKSQGFGAPERRGTLLNYLDVQAGDPTASDPFAGVDLTWSRIPNGERVGRILKEALTKYSPEDPSASIPLLLDAWREMKKLPSTPQLEVKRNELRDVLQAASGLWMELAAKEPSAVPGSNVSLELRVVNRSNVPMRITGVQLPFEATKELTADLANNQLSKTDLTVTVPPSAAFTQPYWLAHATEGQGLYTVERQELVGQADQEPALVVTATIEVAGEELTFELPAIYRWTDRVRGDLSRPFLISPPVTMAFDEKVYVFPSPANQALRIRVRNHVNKLSGSLRLTLPERWGSKPEVARVELDKGQEAIFSFAVAPSAVEQKGTIGAELKVGAESYSKGLVTIDYQHIQQQTLYPEASARALRVDLKRGKEKIGYVMGSGDEIPDILEQIGYQVMILSDDDLATADLDQFDTIITGIRAYNSRDQLKQHHRRLMEFVERGGTMIVQYNTNDDTLASEIGPYPLKLSRERVTMEDAPVKLLVPSHQLLTQPNQISERDFAGWVQERGLYFAGEADPRYTAIMASHDPDEPDRTGGTLVAHYGKGTYIYTGYAFFRQLPAAVPGAYRLFVNMISARQASKNP